MQNVQIGIMDKIFAHAHYTVLVQGWSTKGEK